MKVQGNIFKGLFILIVLVIVIAVISLFTYQIKIYQGNVDSLSLVINGQKINTSSSDFIVSSDNSLRVDVLSPLELNFEYNVEIIPNKIAGKNFYITLSDIYKIEYFDESELSDGFIIDKQDNYFTLKAIGTLTDIFQNYYVNNVANIDNYTYDNMFTAIVTSNNKSVSFNFTIG